MLIDLGVLEASYTVNVNVSNNSENQITKRFYIIVLKFISEADVKWGPAKPGPISELPRT